MDELQEFAERAAEMLKTVAFHESYQISAFDTKVYIAAVALLKGAIEIAYPELDMQDIYDVFIESEEPIEYCAERVK